MAVFLVVFIFVVILAIALKNKKYHQSAYYEVTNNSYLSVKYDKSKYAEYLTYKYLRYFENNSGKFLFNLYIPTKFNKTTEIDVLLISSKGLFVIECKNFSGWIFGDEAQRNWTQSLPKGRGNSHKEYFYNPIMQNAAHVGHLKNLLGKNVPMQSIIVFSDRCVLKKITVRSDNVTVTNHCSLADAVTEIWDNIPEEIYTEKEISDIYKRLYPYTQVDYEVKEQHIVDIENLREKYGVANNY